MEFPAPPRVHVMHVPGADPQRDEIVARLVEQGDACLHLDPDRQGLMVNWLDTLDCAAHRDGDDGHSWSVVLSDDAEPLPGWQQHLERACLNSPSPILGLTHFGSYGAEALRRGLPYAVGSYLIWGGAIAYRTSIVRDLRRWASRLYAEIGYPHDDVLSCAFAMRMGWDVAMVTRAIFGQPVKKSLLGHNTQIRHPATTIEMPGPSYGVRPSSMKVTRSISPRGELQRLAAL